MSGPQGRRHGRRPSLLFGIAGTHLARSGLMAGTCGFGRHRRPNGRFPTHVGRRPPLGAGLQPYGRRRWRLPSKRTTKPAPRVGTAPSARSRAGVWDSRHTPSGFRPNGRIGVVWPSSTAKRAVLAVTVRTLDQTIPRIPGLCLGSHVTYVTGEPCRTAPSGRFVSEMAGNQHTSGPFCRKGRARRGESSRPMQIQHVI